MQDSKPAEEKKIRKVNPWWMQFWIAVLGTSIGVGLTFMVSGLLENRSKQLAQRQAAMMVIDDMDKSTHRLMFENLYGTMSDWYTREHMPLGVPQLRM